MNLNPLNKEEHIKIDSPSISSPFIKKNINDIYSKNQEIETLSPLSLYSNDPFL